MTKEQKQQIAGLARKSGLSQSEYLRQRALGGEPKATLPDAFFVCCERLDRLCHPPFSREVNEAALAVLAEMQNILTGNTVLPVEKGERDSGARAAENRIQAEASAVWKEVITWLLPDSGP